MSKGKENKNKRLLLHLDSKYRSPIERLAQKADRSLTYIGEKLIEKSLCDIEFITMLQNDGNNQLQTNKTFSI